VCVFSWPLAPFPVSPLDDTCLSAPFCFLEELYPWVPLESTSSLRLRCASTGGRGFSCGVVARACAGLLFAFFYSLYYHLVFPGPTRRTPRGTHWQARVRARSAYSYLQRGDRPNNSFRKVSVRKTRLHTHTSGGGASGGATLAIPCLDDTATGEPHGINKSKSARPTECARLGERNKQKRETAKTTTMKQNSPPPPPSH